MFKQRSWFIALAAASLITIAGDLQTIGNQQRFDEWGKGYSWGGMALLSPALSSPAHAGREEREKQDVPFTGREQDQLKPRASTTMAEKRPGEIKPSGKTKEIEPADNSFCYVCHRNFEKEALSATHTKLGIGCEQCHGMSERHSADEDGITPPEIMFSKARINPACVKCHKVEDLQGLGEHEVALAKLKSKSKPASETTHKTEEGKKWICTECHGQHHLKVRTRIWDKDTGKLISDDGVRMMDKSRPGTTKP